MTCSFFRISDLTEFRCVLKLCEFKNWSRSKKERNAKITQIKSLWLIYDWKDTELIRCFYSAYNENIISGEVLRKTLVRSVLGKIFDRDFDLGLFIAISISLFTEEIIQLLWGSPQILINSTGCFNVQF